MTVSQPSNPTVPPKKVGALTWIVFTGLLALTSGCKSDWIQATVINQTGAPIRELEVAYPSASFGLNSLAAGAAMPYRLKIRGTGIVKVEYRNQEGKIIHGEGIELGEHQQGQLTIRLLPEGRFEFFPQLHSSP